MNQIVRLGPLHDMDDESISRALIQQLDAEGNWIAYVPRSNGEVHVRSRLMGHTLEEQKHFWTLRLVEKLNREFRGSGWAWIVAWTDEAILMMPKDVDGDIPAQIEIMDAWVRLRRVGPEKFVEDATALYDYVREHLKAVGVTRDEMHSPARKAPSEAKFRG